MLCVIYSRGSTTPITVTPSSAGGLTARKGGVIFPSVKNKPSIANSTFATDLLANYKDIKVSIVITWPPLRWLRTLIL